MPRFQCTAFDESGKERREEVEAFSETQVFDILKKKNLTLVDLKLVTVQAEVLSEGDSKKKSLIRGKIPIDVILGFYEQLAFLTKAGIPIYMAIGLLGDTFKNKNLSIVLREVLFVLSEGSPLSEALMAYPESFPPFHTSLIAVGEKSGNLDEALVHLVDLVKEKLEIQRDLIKAAAYPVFLLVLSLSLVVGLLLFIFPKFEEIFKAFKVKLPPMTQFFIDTSLFMREHSVIFFLMVSSTLMGIGYLIASEKMSEKRDKFILKIPVFQDVFISMFVSVFAKTMANLLKAGIPLLDALDICRQTIKGKLKEKFFDKLISVVKDGEPTSKGMEDSQLIPVMARQLLVVAEKTGQIDKMMENIFIFYKKRYRETLLACTAILQPLLMLFAAGLIAMVAISLFVPLFKLSSSMKGNS